MLLCPTNWARAHSPKPSSLGAGKLLFKGLYAFRENDHPDLAPIAKSTDVVEVVVLHMEVEQAGSMFAREGKR